MREVIKEVESNIEVLHIEKEKYDKWQRSEIDKKTIEHVLWARTLPLLERKLDLVLLYKFIKLNYKGSNACVSLLTGKE